MAGPPSVAPDVDGDGGREAPLPRAILLLFGSLLLLAVALSLEPLGSYALFGSDTGEYFRLTSDLATTGSIPTSGYGGWGTAYPDFPGLFLLAAGAAGALGISPLDGLVVVVPIVAALSVAPLFLLFRRLVPNPTIALVGAGFAAVFMPRVFSIAHPAPLALGDLLVVGALWMFVEGRRDVRWYVPLTIVSGALILMHHLSSYFFLVSALGGLVILELWRPTSWSRRLPVRELAFLGAFAGVMLAYWLVAAPQFTAALRLGLPGLSAAWLAPSALGIVVGLVAVALLLRWRRAHVHRPPSFRYPSDKSVGRDAAIVAIVLGIAIGALTVVKLPGTMQTTSPSAILYFAPVLFSVVLAAGSRRLVSSSRLGPFSVVWLLALGLSAIVAAATQNADLPADRHAEYLLIPLGLLIAVGIGHLIGRWAVPRGRGAVASAGVAVVLLLAANAAIAYPPPADFGGFEEGLTTGDAALWEWVGLGVPGWATVASDHRLSSMIFGFDGNHATWGSTTALFTGTNRSAALLELEKSNAPGIGRPVNAVAVDGAMFSGVALDPSALAVPMTPQAIAWLTGGPPFVPVYENGACSVYWIVTPTS